MKTVKVIEVKPLDNLKLKVVFENNIAKYYDVQQLFKTFPQFEQLKNTSLFRAVHVDCKGYAVAWSDDLDLSSNDLWVNGVCIT